MAVLAIAGLTLLIRPDGSASAPTAECSWLCWLSFLTPPVSCPDAAGGVRSASARPPFWLVTRLLTHVAACVAETPWTGGAVRDDGRQRGSPCRMVAGLHG